DSGGALVDSAGRVISMNSAAETSARRVEWTSSGQGYAIPIDQAMAIAQQIVDGMASATVHVGERGILGVELSVQPAASTGVTVASVQDGGPAADAGMAPGDTITEIGGTAISAFSDVQQALTPHGPGDRVSVTWTSAAGDHHTATLTLVAGPPA